MISGDQIQFEFEAGKGVQGVTVRTSYRLDDNQWHSVLVEKNRKEAAVIVDGAQKTNVIEPVGPVRPFKLTSPLYIGATRCGTFCNPLIKMSVFCFDSGSHELSCL
jgi:contactin associated protein-like 2